MKRLRDLRASAWCVLLVMTVLAVTGCGRSGNVAKVNGTVTLDGAPLSDALVTFSPKQGAPSRGRTDSSGRYALQYTRDIEGAEIGEHTVSITTASAGNPDAEPPVAPTPEKVPVKYNAKTELTRAVEAGRNTIDFELDSQGPINQPENR